MARWKARGRLPISADSTYFFRQLSRLRRYEQILLEIVLLQRVVGHFERTFQVERGVVHQRIFSVHSLSRTRRPGMKCCMDLLRNVETVDAFRSALKIFLFT